MLLIRTLIFLVSLFCFTSAHALLPVMPLDSPCSNGKNFWRHRFPLFASLSPEFKRASLAQEMPESYRVTFLSLSRTMSAKRLAQFYHAIKNHTESFIFDVEKAKVFMNEWAQLKENLISLFETYASDQTFGRKILLLKYLNGNLPFKKVEPIFKNVRPLYERGVRTLFCLKRFLHFFS